MIKLFVIGHLGKDALMNNVSGKNVLNFTVAHSEKYKDQQGNMVDKTTWVDCAYWTDRVGIAPYLKKGTQVFVEGIPESRGYTAKDGSIASSLTMKVSNIQLLGGRNQDGDGGGYQPTSQAYPSSQPAQQPNFPSQPQPFQTDADFPFSSPNPLKKLVQNTEPIDDLPF